MRAKAASKLEISFCRHFSQIKISPSLTRILCSLLSGVTINIRYTWLMVTKRNPKREINWLRIFHSSVRSRFIRSFCDAAFDVCPFGPRFQFGGRWPRHNEHTMKRFNSWMMVTFFDSWDYLLSSSSSLIRVRFTWIVTELINGISSMETRTHPLELIRILMVVTCLPCLLLLIFPLSDGRWELISC